MRSYWLIFGVAMLAACGGRQEDTTAGGSTTASAQSPGSAPEIQAPTARLWFEPTGLRACDQAQTVTVHWDASSVAGVKRVEVKPVGAEKETVFVYSGAVGSRATGAWVKAGAEFVLRNRADGAELARAKVESLPCQ